jgi:DNA-binding NarL/FixJ family response regulator
MRHQTPESCRAGKLTARECRVHKLMLEALPDKEIAKYMGISCHTVRFHVSNILRKHGVSTRMQLFLARSIASKTKRKGGVVGSG